MKNYINQPGHEIPDFTIGYYPYTKEVDCSDENHNHSSPKDYKIDDNCIIKVIKRSKDKLNLVNWFIENNYIFRHHKDLKTGDPTRAGYLSMFVLWNKPSLAISIRDYRRRLGIYNRTGKFPTKITGYTSKSYQ